MLDSFETEIQRIKLPDDADWQAILRAWGQAFRDGVRNLGAMGRSFHLSRLVELTMKSGEAGSIMLPWAERVFHALVSAGFAVDDAGSILALVARTAVSTSTWASDSQPGDRAHRDELARALTTADQREFPMFGQIVADRKITPAEEADFHFALTVIIAGLESHLKATLIAK